MHGMCVSCILLLQCIMFISNSSVLYREPHALQNRDTLNGEVYGERVGWFGHSAEILLSLNHVLLWCVRGGM